MTNERAEAAGLPDDDEIRERVMRLLDGDALVDKLDAPTTSTKMPSRAIWVCTDGAAPRL